MALADLLTRIDKLQARIIAAGPLSAEAKRRLDYRFRLDWNYHSNVMEGSSLTKLETRTIMLGNVTVDGKPIKDVLEMKGHDDVITKLLQMSSGELQLSEARIKEVHKAIVKEDDPEKKEWVGRWKPVPNYLTNYRGERIDFTPPEHVAEAMHRLLDRTKADIERIERKASDAPHPALLAFDFHREYVTIHPFHDGNGRTARIFSNLLLMRFGLPPVIIKLEEKEAYNRFLAEVQVYGASPDLFNEFMGERLMRSLELVVDALAGKDLAESNDLAKRAEILFVHAEGARLSDEQRQARTRQLAHDWIEENLEGLVQRISSTFSVFNKFFRASSFRYLISVEGKRNYMPTFESALGAKVNELRAAGDIDAPLRIRLIFSDFNFSQVKKEEHIEAEICFEFDRVVMNWPHGYIPDIFSYGAAIAGHRLDAMQMAATDFLDSIQERVRTGSNQQDRIL